MPNPINLIALDGARAQFSKNGTQPQRITLTKGAELHIVELPEAPIPLSTGEWTVKHETLYYGQWRNGLGRRDSDYKASFDDNPDGLGDNDYNDAVVHFVVA